MLEITTNSKLSPNFKTAQQSYAPQGYRQGNLPPQMLNRDMLMLREAEKKEKRKEAWNKAGVLASIGLAGAFITMAITSVLTHKASKKAMEAQAKYFSGAGENSAKKQADELSRVDLTWSDLKDKKEVVGLDSATTADSVKNAFKKILNLGNLSEKAKKWGGIKPRTRFFYIFGQPGTGKTYSAKQYAQEVDGLFTCIKYSDLGSPFKDAGSMKIDTMGKNIREMSQKNPDRQIVVCIDEADALFKKVNDSSLSSGEERKARSTVLATLDKILDDCSNVTIMTTSNYSPTSKVIDGATLRRLAKIEVPLSNEAQLDAVVQHALKDVEAIDDKFWQSKQYKDFLKTLHDEKYSNGEAEKIAKDAIDSFGNDLVGVAENDIPTKKFDVKYLLDGKKSQGVSAANMHQYV